MISAELTHGMSSIEVWIVMLAAVATEQELWRLRKFFDEFVQYGKQEME